MLEPNRRSVRGHLELALEPLPLAFAEHRRLRVGVARVRTWKRQSRGDAFLGPHVVSGAAKIHAASSPCGCSGGPAGSIARAHRAGRRRRPRRRRRGRAAAIRQARSRSRGRCGARPPSSGTRRRRRSRRSRGRPTSRRSASRRAAAQNPAARRARRISPSSPTCPACRRRCCRPGTRTGRVRAPGWGPRRVAACRPRRRSRSRCATACARAPGAGPNRSRDLWRRMLHVHERRCCRARPSRRAPGTAPGAGAYS